MAQHLGAQLRKQRFIPDAVFRRRLVEQGFELVAAQMLEYRRLRLPGQPLRAQVQELTTERTDVVGRQVEMVQPLTHGASPCVSWRVRTGAGYLRSVEHTSGHQTLMRYSYDCFCLKTKQESNATTSNDKR